MEEGKAFLELSKEFHENRLAHAFLLETNNPDKCFQNLVQFLKVLNCPSTYREGCSNCQFCHLIDSHNLPSFVVVEPDGMTIKKDQILFLKQFFQTKPVYSKYNMYVVKSAECLNSSSANTMLKFIEEPQDFTIGFFITNNKENIIDTIRSRCQIIKDFYNEGSDISVPDVWMEIALQYLKEILKNPLYSMLYNKDVLLPLIHDRKELNYLFQSIQNIYYQCYVNALNRKAFENELQFLQNKDKIFFQKQLQLTMEMLDRLNYNLNISLALDYFVVKGSDLS